MPDGRGKWTGRARLRNVQCIDRTMVLARAVFELSWFRLLQMR